MDPSQKTEDLADVFALSTLCTLVSDEGPVTVPRSEIRVRSASSAAASETVAAALLLPELVLGPDVSHDQGGDIQWDEVASAAHVKFAFCKATEGLRHVDPSFNRNWAAIKQTPLIRGAYHLGHPKNKPRDEAGHFLSTVGDDADLLALDLAVSDEQSPAQILEWTTAFLEYLDQSTATRVILHTGGLWKYQLGNPTSRSIGRFPLWLAQYADVTTLPKPWRRWAFWQYTDGTYCPSAPLPTSIPGVGKCDVSRFNGSCQDLHNFVARAAPRPLAPRWPGRCLKLTAPRMTGPDVVAWQERMKARGWSLVVDGVYNPETRGVTIGFQKHMKVEADGVVNPATWALAWA